MNSNNNEPNQEFNQAKIEYDRMTSFHEKLGTKLIGAIGLLFTVFGLLFYSSFKDMKEEMKSEAKEIKEKAKEAKQDYDKDLEDVKIDAKEILARNKEISDFQIQFLKDDVKSMALSSSKNRIDEILNSPNVQALIEQQTRKEVAEKLNEVVQEETTKIREIFDYLPQITIASDLVRQGSRTHLNILDSLSNFSSNSEIRKLAKKLLLKKGMDYKNALLKINDNIDYSDRPRMSVVMGDVPDTTVSTLRNTLGMEKPLSNEDLIKMIVNRMKTEKDLFTLTLFYLHLNKISNQNFQFFDSKPVYYWYNKNYK